jgi:hypothetical protein
MTDRLDNHFKNWATQNSLLDQDQKKGARVVYEAGWNARGNPWATVLNNLVCLALLAYVITLIVTL